MARLTNDQLVELRSQALNHAVHLASKESIHSTEILKYARTFEDYVVNGSKPADKTT